MNTESNSNIAMSEEVYANINNNSKKKERRDSEEIGYSTPKLHVSAIDSQNHLVNSRENPGYLTSKSVRLNDGCIGLTFLPDIYLPELDDDYRDALRMSPHGNAIRRRGDYGSPSARENGTSIKLAFRPRSMSFSGEGSVPDDVHYSFVWSATGLDSSTIALSPRTVLSPPSFTKVPETRVQSMI